MVQSNSKLKTTGLIVILLCLIWMDTCLYLRIQSIDDNECEMHTMQRSNNDSLVYTTNTTQLKQLLPFMDEFSRIAFQGMSIKLMMTDPVDNYLMGPLSEAFADLIDFKHNLLFISANMVSYAGVLAALIAAKLVTYDSLTMHRLSFVMFQLRTWLDDLDGVVARSRMGIYKHVSLSKTSGYVVDGVCDAIGFVAYVIGCYIYMKRTLVVRHQKLKKRQQQQQQISSNYKHEIGYNLQSITEIKSANSSDSAAAVAYLPLVQNEDMIEEQDEESDSGNHNKTNDNSLIDLEEEQILHNMVTIGDHQQKLIDKDDNNEQHQRQNQSQHDALIELVPGGRGGGGRLLGSRSTTGKGKYNRIFFTTTTRPLSRGSNDSRPTHLIFYRYIKEKIKNDLNNRRAILLVLCFLLQLAMCSTFWNRYILIYRSLLESTSTSIEQSRAKRKIMKSNIMYLLIWFWRLTNGHSFMQMLIGSVFLGKLWQFLNFIKYIGFVEIILLATVTELHIIDIRNFLTN